MPKEFEDLVKKIKASMLGKTNPRTRKPYTESDCYAIAVSQWKRSHGGKAPSREESPSWYCEGGKEVRTNVNLSWNELIESFKESDKESEPLVIRGMAINEVTTRNNIKYVGEELEKAAPSLVGKPILNTHRNDAIENILGKVLEATKVPGGISYVAEIDSDEKKVINKIKKGYLNKVSIGAGVKELVKEEVTEGENTKDVYLAKGIEFFELSLVPVPGDANTSVTLVHALSESFNDCEPHDDVVQNEKTEENKDMVEEDIKALKEKIAALEADKKKVEDEKKKLEDDKKAEDAKKKEESFKEALKKEIMEELKKAEKEDEEDEAEDKPEEKKEEKDKSKGLVEAPKEDVKEDVKNLIIERSREGVSFWMKK